MRTKSSPPARPISRLHLRESTAARTFGHFSSTPFAVPRRTRWQGRDPACRGKSTPSFSANRRRVAFVSGESGMRSVWIKDVPDGREWRASASPFAQRFPVLTRSGRQVAFSSYERDKRPAYVVRLPGGTPEMVCHNCLQPGDWSPDESELLVTEGSPYRITAIHKASRKRRVLIQRTDFSAIYRRYSPDGRWLSFTLRRTNNHASIMIAPLESGGRPIAEQAWIEISGEQPEDRANWSPDGNTLNFTSSRDGHLCLWGQRIHPVTWRPVGDPFAAHHFHDRLRVQYLGWSLAEGRVAMALMELTGNILMLSPSGGR